MRTSKRARPRAAGTVQPTSKEAAWARAVDALTDWHAAGQAAIGTDVALALLSLDTARGAEASAGMARFTELAKRGADPVTGCLPVTAPGQG